MTTRATKLAMCVGVVLVFGGAATAPGATFRVPGDYAGIRLAIEAADVGDTVLVAPGTYSGPANTNCTVRDRDLVILSEAGPEATIIDCQDVSGVRGFELIDVTRATIVEGFTVTRALHNGGAISVLRSAPTIRRCILERSTTPGSGSGGITIDVQADALIEDCALRDNFYAGGFTVQGGSTAAFVRCRIVQNESGGGAGGLVWDDASVTLEDCTISGNVAGQTGGGLEVLGARLEMTRCLIVENYAGSYGGGIDVNYDGEVTLHECTVARNSTGMWGGGIDMQSPSNGFCHIEHCIISDNCAPHGSDLYLGGTANISCSALAPSGVEVGNLGELIYADDPVTSDPLFCAPSVCPGLMPVPTGDYQLRSDSSCLPESSPCGQLIGALGIGCWVPPTGACCRGLDCEVLAPSECADLGGIYKGDGVPCEPSTCDQTPVLETSWGKIKAQFREEAKKARSSE